MTCIQIGGALVHFADEEYENRHHASYQARCEDCGRFLRWVETSWSGGAWWECSLHGAAPR